MSLTFLLVNNQVLQSSDWVKTLVFVVFSYRDSLIHSSVGGKKIDAWARLIFPGVRCLDGCLEGMEGNDEEVFVSKVPVVFSFFGDEEIAPAH